MLGLPLPTCYLYSVSIYMYLPALLNNNGDKLKEEKEREGERDGSREGGREGGRTGGREGGKDAVVVETS